MNWPRVLIQANTPYNGVAFFFQDRIRFCFGMDIGTHEVPVDLQEVIEAAKAAKADGVIHINHFVNVQVWTLTTGLKLPTGDRRHVRFFLKPKSWLYITSYNDFISLIE